MLNIELLRQEYIYSFNRCIGISWNAKPQNTSSRDPKLSDSVLLSARPKSKCPHFISIQHIGRHNSVKLNPPPKSNCKPECKFLEQITANLCFLSL